MIRNLVECENRINQIMELESQFVAIKTLSSKEEMERVNEKLNKELVCGYREVKEFLQNNSHEKELTEKFEKLSKIINLSNQIDDFIRYDKR